MTAPLPLFRSSAWPACPLQCPFHSACSPRQHPTPDRRSVTCRGSDPHTEQAGCPRSARTGITTAQFQALNPLVLCDNGLYAGSAVCTGNTIAFCNDVVVASPGDTCNSIASDRGAVINVDGESGDKLPHVLTSRHCRCLILHGQDLV